MRIARFLASAIFLFALAVSAQAQNTIAVSASLIKGGPNGAALTSGSLCFQATDQNNNNIVIQSGGGGAVVATPFCTAITNGAITTFNVPNPATSAPVNVRYRITITQGSRTVATLPIAYLCLQSGACTSPYTFNFDNCLSSGACLANPLPMTSGPAGPPGAAGANGTNGTNGAAGPPGLPCTGGVAAYASGTTYALNNCASDTGSGTIYISLSNSNTGHTPSTSPTFWAAPSSGAATSTDNTYTNNQRFKGPISPNGRDFTAYMPAGGCVTTSPFPYPTTGNIAATSAALTLAAGKPDYKVGCYVTILGAGVTSTIQAPPSSCSIASITRSALTNGLTTVTCSGNHGLVIWNGGSTGVVITGVTDSTFDGTYSIGNVQSATVFSGWNTSGPNLSSSGGTATFVFGYAHGVTGSTQYYYKVRACDAGMGCSPATSAISISNGNATLTSDNYNWISFPNVSRRVDGMYDGIQAYMYPIYRAGPILTSFTDNATRADENPLSDGGAWSPDTAYRNFQLTTNLIEPLGSAPNVALQSLFGAWGPDQTNTVTLHQVLTGALAGPMVRANIALNEWYVFVVPTLGTSGMCGIANFAAYLEQWACTFNVGDTAGLQVAGYPATITPYQNGSAISGKQITGDTSIPDAGAPGIYGSFTTAGSDVQITNVAATASGSPSYTCIGASPTYSFVDYGNALPCPLYAPADDSGGNTPDALTTSVTAVSGTSVTLNTAASNTVTSVPILPDTTPFLAMALTDVANDLDTHSEVVGERGVYIPTAPGGYYSFNSLFPTAYITPSGSTNVEIGGYTEFETYPLFIGGIGYHVTGVGGGGGAGQFSTTPRTQMYCGQYTDYCVVFMGGASGASFNNIGFGYIPANGIWGGVTNTMSPGASGIEASNDYAVSNPVSGGGILLTLDNDSINNIYDKDDFEYAGAGNDPLPLIQQTMSLYMNGNPTANVITNLKTVHGTIRMDAPGGYAGGGVVPLGISNWVSESNPYNYYVDVDNSTSKPAGTLGVEYYLSVNGLEAADGTNYSLLHEHMGYDVTGGGTRVHFSGDSGGMNRLGYCGPDPTCPPVGGMFNGVSTGPTNALNSGGSFELNNQGQHYWKGSGLGLEQNPNTPTLPIFYVNGNSPQGLVSCGASSGGSLAAGTYYLAVTGVTDAGETLASNELPVTVTSGQKVCLNWYVGTYQYGLFADFHIYYGTAGPGSESQYIDVGAPGGFEPQFFSFTTTSGAVTQALPLTNTASLDYLTATGACLRCSSGHPVGGMYGWFPMGVGDPAPPAGSKLSVIGGFSIFDAIHTRTNCSNGAAPAVCGSATGGSVAVPIGTNPTLVVDTTAVTAVSQILLTIDESATISGVTCNTTLSTLVQPVVTARTAGTSFTMQIGSTLATNPACVHYSIMN